MSMRRTGPSKVSQRCTLADALNRNLVLIAKIKGLETQIAAHEILNAGMSSRVQKARMQIDVLIASAATNSQSFSPVSIHNYNAETYRILSQLVGTPWYNIPANINFEREVRAMFSQQHYAKVAELIKAQRVRIETDHTMPPVDKDAQHKAINELQAALIKTFEDDNPKFKTFRFIEAASHHAIT